MEISVMESVLSLQSMTGDISASAEGWSTLSGICNLEDMDQGEI
ncbi:hypothetical protein [Inconstantimicrobium mannanitabidum]|uniref:Uncharacterized protein n=1 Tax=Inconstantimicrobium mannanitabidum TaxID=1604901 RepID=A0ACB5RIS1_9CLOT|nr:hypothetical protein [Clostridium sp. TW13]GKX69005.1 hypothetical protein rsdtw13_42630 [Clostridium sp. TW13]